MIPRAVCILIGYLFGMIQTAYLYGKSKGVDIRTVGSGNAGTTNTLRSFGTGAGVLVFFGDSLKCVAAVLVVSLIFKNRAPEILRLLKIYAGLGAILGHNFPCYLSFRGGKGIACTAGLIITLEWPFVVFGLLSFFVPFLLTHYVSLGSLLLNVVFVAITVIMGQAGKLGLAGPQLTELYIISAVIAALAFLRHRDNITGLLRGTERKTYLKKKA